MAAFPDPGIAQLPWAMTHHPDALGSPGAASAPHNAEHDPRADPPSPPSEATDANLDNTLWEFLRFDGEEEGDADGQGH